MSRTIILSLAAAVTIATAGLASTTADARGFGGGFARGGGGLGGGHISGRGGRTTLARVSNPGRTGHPGHPGHPGRFSHWHPHHGHWLFRDGVWVDIGEGEVPYVAPAPGPCTCLTKNYTPDGLVVFADVCTKESASSPVDGRAADATQVPATQVPATQVPATQVPATQVPTTGAKTSDTKSADAAQTPTTATNAVTNYAGRTYKDYLAANPQASTPAPQKN